MKKVVIFACAGLVVLTLSVFLLGQKKTTLYVDKKDTNTAIESSEVQGMPVLKFAKTKYDFGSIKKEDSPITVVFEFQNEGDVPLVIQKVDVSCGCMSIEYPKQPTMPKGTGTILVKIDLQNQSGTFNRTLFVKSNATEDLILLRIKGQVK